MRRPNSMLHNYNNTSFIREFEFPIGVTVSVLAWMVLASYYGVIVLGMFAVVLLTGAVIGSIQHYKQTSTVLSCVPASEVESSEEEGQIRKAA
jgi:hypothetical protein